MVYYLIAGPAWIGDMVMANALFRLLKFRDPTCVIDVLAPRWSHPLLTRMPEVRRAIMMTVGHGAFNLRERYRIGRALRAEHYTHAIILPNSFKSALIPWWAHIPKRTGWRGEWRYGVINDLHYLDKKRYPWMVQRYLALGLYAVEGTAVTTASNIEDFYPCLSVDCMARALTLKKYGMTLAKPLLILCPGAQYGASKRWPLAYFATVAAYYSERDWQVAILGGQTESACVAQINARLLLPAFDLTATTLTEAIDLISIARAVVSNDSGLMHIACALQRKVIAIYGSSSPDFTPPLHATAVVLSKSLPCKPCFKRECPLQHLNCLKMITPQEVIAAISE